MKLISQIYSSSPSVVKRVVNLLRLFIRMFQIITENVTETFTLIKITVLSALKIYDDREYLGYTIRKHSHILEKDLLDLFDNKVHHKVYLERLKQYLGIWFRRGYDIDETIQWSRRILDEYETRIRDDFKCPMIGKTHKQEYDSSSILEIIKSRRSIRHWADEEVSDSIILQLIDAARWGPSSCNRQTLHFLVVKDKEKIKKISQYLPGGSSFFPNAPLLIVVLVDVRPYVFPYEKHTPYQDAAAAIQNLLLFAHSLGLGGCWANFTRSVAAGRGNKQLKTYLGIPKFFEFCGVVAVGKPFSDPHPPARRPISDIVSIDKYDNRMR